FVDGLYLAGERENRRRVEPEEPVLGLGPGETIDGLENRQPPAGLQHAEELIERAGLVLELEVDKNRARRHGGDRFVLDRRQDLPSRLDELTAGENAGIAGELPAALEQIPRDVAEDHPAALADAVQRSERDQTVAAADVEHRVAGGERGVVEHPVADGSEVLHRRRES